ncbi:MAG: hypothetical protein DRH97_06160, partial [Chloroflexi bacterium]
DSSTFRLENVNATDSLGNSSYWFNPNCTYLVGQNYWIAGVEDSCYEDENATATNYTLNMTGDLIPVITSPNGGKYLRGETDIVMRGNITDECGVNITSAYVNFTAIQSSEEQMCSSTNNEGDGNYNCTVAAASTSSWTPSNMSYMPSGLGYDIKFNLTADFYNYNTTTDTYLADARGVFLETKPNLTDPSVTSDGDGGWGETWRFSVNVTDEDYDNLAVKLWLRKCTDSGCTAFSPDWDNPSTNGTQFVVAGVNKMLIFNLSNYFGEDAMDVGGYWQYKFNVTDWVVTDAWDVNESSTQNLTLDRDDINITYIVGNNTVVNRSIAPSGSNATLSVRIYDIDKNIVLPPGSGGAGKFYVTTDPNNNTNFTVDYSIGIDGSGWINNTFPDSARCTYDIGMLRWMVGYNGSGYKDTNSTDFYNAFFVNTTTYPLQVVILHPNNDTFRRNIDPIPIWGNVSDDCSATYGRGVRNVTVTYNAYPVGSWTTCQGQDLTNNGTYTCNLSSSASATFSRYNVSMDATKTYYNDSNTTNRTDAFWITTGPLMWGEDTDKAGDIGGWGETWTFSVHVMDEDRSGYAWESMNVSLWLNMTGDWELYNSTACSGPGCAGDTLIEFAHVFNCGDQGSKDFKFNVTDYWNQTNTTSSNAFTIEKDNVQIEFYSDPLQINRESGNGEFVFRINDTDSGTYINNTSTSTVFYFTRNGSSYDISIQNNPGSDGYVNYTLDPNCSYSVGSQYWKGGTGVDECYDTVNFTSNPTFNVTGQLKNNLTLPIYGSNYNVTEQIPINFTTFSDCSAARGDENPVINASAFTIEMSLAGSGWELCSSNNSYDGWYNCTWNSTAKAEGLWDVRVNSSKDGYFYTNTSVYTDWFELLNWNVSNTSTPTVSPTDGGWTRLYNYTIGVYDQEGDTVNCSLFISRDDQSTWENKGSYIVAGTPGTPTAGICYKELYDYVCSDTGTDNWFMWQIVN